MIGLVPPAESVDARRWGGPRLRKARATFALHPGRRGVVRRWDPRLDGGKDRARALSSTEPAPTRFKSCVSRDPGSGARMKRIGLLGGSFNPAHTPRTGESACSRSRRSGSTRCGGWSRRATRSRPTRPTWRSLPARLASAARMARHAPIVPTAIETRLGTRYTVDTLRAIVRRYPRDRFVWIMGADNLAQFDRWKQWRRIAKTLPIAVVARPGYDSAGRSGVAMGWLEPFRPARIGREAMDAMEFAGARATAHRSRSDFSHRPAGRRSRLAPPHQPQDPA